MLAQLAVADRLTIVDTVGTPGDGASLAGQNVNQYPAGAIFFVRSTKRFYSLKKNLNASVVATNLDNVVDGIGSSAAAGRFIAIEQAGNVTLSAGTAVISGFDFTNTAGVLDASNYSFLITMNTSGGTPGFPRAQATAVNQVTITSSSNSDTSNYFLLAVPRYGLT